jgi:hypothetical protein
MFSTPVNTLEERAILMRLLAGVHTVGHVALLEARPPRQIVMVRANRVCRRRFPLPELAAIEGSSREAGRGWRRGSAWDDSDGRSIWDRLHAAAAAGGLGALGADREPANGAAEEAGDRVPALV